MKKEVIFDSSTAILLAKVSLLRHISGEIAIVFPKGVEEETTRNKELFDARLIDELIRTGKISVLQSPKIRASQYEKDFSLGLGEAQAIALAQSKKCMIATDDWPSIKVCKIFSIPFATAVHFLLSAYEKRDIDKKTALEKLRMLKHHGRYSGTIIRRAQEKLEGN